VPYLSTIYSIIAPDSQSVMLVLGSSRVRVDVDVGPVLHAGEADKFLGVGKTKLF
jgi:hypothetical protein